MKPLGIDHVSVTVRDIDRSLAFYCRILHLRLLGRGEEEVSLGPVRRNSRRKLKFRYADLELRDDRILELLQYIPSPKRRGVSRRTRPGHGHFGFAIEGLDETVRALEKAGFPAAGTIQAWDSPAWWKGTRSVYVLDPDGAMIELVERLPRRRQSPLSSLVGTQRLK